MAASGSHEAPVPLPKVAFVTVPPSEATSLARVLVDSELVACVNIIPGVTSVYKWKGEVNTDSEHILMIKTRTENVDAVTALVQKEHSYDTPEVIFLPVTDGSSDYMQWIRDVTVLPTK